MICQIELELNAGHLDSEVKDNVAAENDTNAESCENEAFDDHQGNDKDQIICLSEPEVRADSIRATTTNARNPQLPYPITAQEGPTAKRKTRNKFELPISNKNPQQLDPCWETPCLALNNDSTSQWPLSGWSSSPVKLNLIRPSEEQLRHHALRLHTRALAAYSSGSESEEEEDDCRVGDGENDEVYKLLNLFVEEDELRSYYEGNWDSGEFYCLVCGGLGKSKKIKGCVGLVHHAISISKTKKKRAHKAFA